MKFHIYNPEPFNDCSNPACTRFHSKSQEPPHIFDCYRKTERSPINFQCTDRIHKLSEPHPRHSNRKYVKDVLWSSWTRTNIPTKFNVSSRIDHLAAPFFRRVYTARQNFESYRNVSDAVKQNLNLQLQRTMYNIYSRLQNVKFPNTINLKSTHLPKSIKSSAANFEKRLKAIERLSQPRKIPQPQTPVEINQQKRPVSMEAIKRLAIPRKIKSPEQFTYSFPSRPLQSHEYYEKLSRPRKILEDVSKRDLGPKLTSMNRIKEMAVPLSRIQRRKFMKGDNEPKCLVSRAALQYKASAKIIKLAVPRQTAEDSNQPATKNKRKK